MHLLIILLLYSVPEAVWLIIDPGRPQRGQRQLKLECSLCRITMHFPFLRRSKAFFAVGFRDHSVIWALEFLPKNHNSVFQRHFLFRYFIHSQFLMSMCVCLCEFFPSVLIGKSGHNNGAFIHSIMFLGELPAVKSSAECRGRCLGIKLSYLSQDLTDDKCSRNICETENVLAT